MMIVSVVKKLIFFVFGGVIAACVSSCNKNDFIGTDEPAGPNLDKLIVYEYTPAPGQFINETGPMTASGAALWAQKRIEGGTPVSLGAFGGYMVLGLGHSFGDFVIKGNAFVNASGASNEPGVVSVMQDTNGNGLPDDEWFELLGSESSKESTLHDYAVTYYKPAQVKQAVRWTDNLGNEGTVDYVEKYHSQDYYYPLWIEADSYVLIGTRVSIESSVDELGLWWNNPLKWGYVDNVGSNGDVFHISDAVRGDGSKANLKYVDFVKVQTAVNGNRGPLGELSTEISSFKSL